MKPNWFVGLPVRSEQLNAHLTDAPEILRMYAPSDLHITVAFLGAIPADVAKGVWESYSFTMAPTSALLGPVQLFGRPGRATALGFNVVPNEPRRRGLVGRRRSEDASDAWLRFVDSLRSERNVVLDLAECRPDEREPRPHVTIARVPRNATSLERRRAIGWAERLTIDEPVDLNGIALYTWSERRDASSRFRIVEERSL